MPWKPQAGAGSLHPAHKAHPQATAEEGLQEGRLAHSSSPHHITQKNVPLCLSLLLVQALLTSDCGWMARTTKNEGLPGRDWARPA